LVVHTAERLRSLSSSATAKRSLCLGPSGETTDLRPLRATAIDAVAVRPHRRPARATPPELQNLTMLCHHGTSLESMANRGINATPEGR